MIILAAEHHQHFMFMDESIEFLEGTAEFAFERFFFLFGKFDQRFHIFDGTDQRLLAVGVFLQAGAALLHLLCIFLVVPEIRIGNFFVEFSDLFAQAVRVKDTPVSC